MSNMKIRICLFCILFLGLLKPMAQETHTEDIFFSQKPVMYDSPSWPVIFYL